MNKLPFTLNYRIFILALILFGSIGYLYYEVLGLRNEVTRLAVKVEMLSQDPPPPVAPPPASASAAAPVSAPVVAAPIAAAPQAPAVASAPKALTPGWKDELIRHLKEINGGQSPKRIIYQKGAVLVMDATLANEDPFFEMLGYLMDEERFVRIELPKKLYESPLPKGLVGYGIAPGAVRSAPIPHIKVVLKE